MPPESPTTPAAKPRILEVRTQILKKNDELARDLRARFRAANCFVVSLVSSPGTGKTEFLKQTLTRLQQAGDLNLAALVGDLRTDHDAARLAESGTDVRQIETGTMCHLEADMVERAIDAADWNLSDLDLLFVENVGNLVCPSGFDLGEDLRLVLVSTTEGEDKPLKYPTIFNTADVAVVTKMDLAEVLGYDAQQMRDSIQDVRPGMTVHELSARSGQGMTEWIDWLRSRLPVRPA
ncbi:MAG: hydrogenase nickel incorporation protein HypB [Planctomycetota bacterium]